MKKGQCTWKGRRTTKDPVEEEEKRIATAIANANAFADERMREIRNRPPPEPVMLDDDPVGYARFAARNKTQHYGSNRRSIKRKALDVERRTVAAYGVKE